MRHLKRQDLLLLVALFVLIFAGLSTGVNDVQLSEVIKWILGSSGLSDEQTFILSGLRLPRTMSAVAIGGALATSGLLLQTLLKNPLAEPYTLGLSGGATLGAVAVIFLLPLSGSFGISLGAIVGCWLAAGIMLAVIRSTWGHNPQSLILIGVMVSLFCGAIVSLGFALFQPTELSRAMAWLMGSLGSSRDQFWPYLLLALGIVVIWIWIHARDLDTLHLGLEMAQSLGVNSRRLRIQIIICVTVLTSLSVAMAGLLGFVGLVAPHLVYRLKVSRRHKDVAVATALLGSSLLTFADIFARRVGGDFEIPVGGVTALFGAPMLIYLIYTRGRHV